jgi:hypothetical protein
VETPHNVEILHRAETFSLLSMFYFRATKSFRVNRRPGADNRAGTSRTVPGSTALSRCGANSRAAWSTDSSTMHPSLLGK